MQRPAHAKTSFTGVGSLQQPQESAQVAGKHKTALAYQRGDKERNIKGGDVDRLGEAAKRFDHRVAENDDRNCTAQSKQAGDANACRHGLTGAEAEQQDCECLLLAVAPAFQFLLFLLHIVDLVVVLVVRLGSLVVAVAVLALAVRIWASL
jgi:hypothetical protein